MLLALLHVHAPMPVVAAPAARPRILYVHLSSRSIRSGETWSGHVVTTTNVASVVISMPFFSFVIPRRAFGDFVFKTRVLAVPSLYRRKLYGSIIAYNTAGESVSAPIAIDFR